MDDQGNSFQQVPTPARRRWPWIAAFSTLGAIFVFAVTMAVVSLNSDLSTKSPTSSTSNDKESVADVPTKSTVTVEYEVFGDGDQETASITMTTETGMIQRDIRLPLKNKNTGVPGIKGEFPPGSFVSILAQGRESYGSITCRITVDGAVVSENMSTGYGVASCHGRS